MVYSLKACIKAIYIIRYFILYIIYNVTIIDIEKTLDNVTSSTLSSLNLPLSSSSTTSSELLSQFSTCSGWRWFDVVTENCNVLVNKFHGNFRSKTPSYRKIKSVSRDVKWCFNAWWGVNPLTAKLFNLNFHPIEVVSCWLDPQLQVSENYSELTKWRSTVFKSCWLMSHFIFNIFKTWYLMC